MAREYFSVSESTSLSDLKIGSKIHVIGVCGVAMAQLAILLSELGYQVSGSDKEFYEPMGSKLRSSNIKLFNGYHRVSITPDIDLAVIGNAVPYQNEEVQQVESLKLKYSLFPKLLHDICIAGRRSVVVAGTHGKSTTTSMIAVMLRGLGMHPSYFIGAAVAALPNSLMADSNGKICVVEGDEYDSSFFAKVPKFSFYQPDIFIVTSIEFDHADIYKDLDAIKKVFIDRIRSLSKNSFVVCCIDDPVIRSQLDAWRAAAQCKFITYGESPDSDYTVHLELEASKMKIEIDTKQGKYQEILKLSGRHNALNTCAALIVANIVGADLKEALSHLASFEGARRRQEVRFDQGRITVIDDFAHHPTAVRETLSGLKQAYPDRRMIAVFEPRSNTSRRKVFEVPYAEAFQSADLVVLSKVKARSIDSDQDLLDVGELALAITKQGVSAEAIDGVDSITNHLANLVTAGDLVVIMSNGSFDGLIEKFLARLG